ncbi:MAG: AhpC/TSA family protein [Prevotella sp.]|nr:AhpC/TSA family protein [Prevotella sp.]
MKRLLFTFFALIVCLGISAQKYTVNGIVEGLPDGTVLQLIPMSHGKETPLGETTVQGGKFKFTGSVKEPICGHVTVKDSYGYCSFMLENCGIVITATVTKGKAHDGVDLYTWKSNVLGSPLTEKYNGFVAEREKIDELYMANQRKFQHVHEKVRSLKGDELTAYKKTDEYQSLEKADREFFQHVDKTLNGLILDNKDSFWGPLLAHQYMSYFTPDQRNLYNQFSDAAKNSWYGKKMKEELWPAGGVGEKIPSFTIKDEAGKAYTFQQLAKGKKYVLLDFWASWCAPCRKEIPNVKKQYDLYKDKGFEVISISIDRNAAQWKKALEEEQLKWPNFLSNEVADQFKVKAVPTMYLVDTKGVILAENDDARGEKLAAKLAELFK